jgi:dipeptidyl aminopeptidase/acylaminoacyl peptidase
MKSSVFARTVLFALLALTAAPARDVRDDMRRADRFGRDLPSVTGDQVRVFWADHGDRLFYRVNHARDRHRFLQVDLKSGATTSAFDHATLAKALEAETSQNVNPERLPIEQLHHDGSDLRFRAFDKGWRFDAATATLAPEQVEPSSIPLLAPDEVMRGRRDNGPATSLTIENATGGEIEVFWVQGRNQRRSYGRIPAAGSSTQSTYAGHVWLLTDAEGNELAGIRTPENPSVARVTGKVRSAPRPDPDRSPDGKWRAVIRDHNLAIIPADGGEPIALTRDGRAGHSYGGPLLWSPDSRKLAAGKTRHVETRRVHIVESSPEDQLQPKLRSFSYAKPGDEISKPLPVLFDIETRTPLEVDSTLFDNPWSIQHEAWSPDSAEFSFVYNQRGHQVMRILAIRADSGSVRVIHEESSDTFIDYSQKFFLHRLPDSGDLLWASERDGHNHLYRIDVAAGAIRNPVTQGNWNVRRVVEVDESKSELVLAVNGMPGSDPYHEHFARVKFDGSGFTRLTQSDGHHRIDFSPDKRHLVATWSRVDQPPVTELRDASDGRLIAELSRADDSALVEAGWQRPERFVAKGRDGKTDIHGIIVRPSHFDPSRKYPILEDIYAGPHDFFVPKGFSTWSGRHAMAELGFILVKIDGMGTNWRSKEFHDVCWKNVADGGLPDRVEWIKAAAASRPWMDLDRVGIYGGSAGGQSTLAALLHHGDFYKVGVADCGCHDNRMDKIWWNEAWMGWPVDDSYARNSNATHAAKLQGKLMLIVGELDNNVDPASTTQVVGALQKADKHFDFVPIINAGHGAAETPYGKFRRADFLVTHLQASGAP